MLIALTGTPGTGKTSVAKILQKKGFKVIDLNQFAREEGFIVGTDEKRDSDIVDIESINDYFKDFKADEIVIVDGHLSHLISHVDKVILFRCKPEKLKLNLRKKNWNDAKIKENIEAEILDIILSECADIHDSKDIFEIDTSNITIRKSANVIQNIISNNFKNIKKYKIGKIDWSEKILKDFLNQSRRK